MSAIRILLVEDEAAFAEVIGELLRDEGYAVVRARNGITALNMIATERMWPDLIVCDVMLPGLSGERLAVELRRRYPRRRLPILLLSASVDPRVRLPDVWFMSKPVDFKEFMNTIQRLIEPRQRGAVAAV